MSNQGWQCPICERVFAPSVLECKYCGEKDIGKGNDFLSVPQPSYTPVPGFEPTRPVFNPPLHPLSPDGPRIPPITCKVEEPKYEI